MFRFIHICVISFFFIQTIGCAQFLYGARFFPHGKGAPGIDDIPGEALAATVDVSIAALIIKGGATSVGSVYGGLALIIWIGSVINNIRGPRFAPKCLKGNCEDGFGVQKDLCIYEGNFVGSRYAGDGTLKCEDWEYIGSWKDGKFAERGKITRAGKVYEGPIVNGVLCFRGNCINGKGALVYYGGAGIYAGDFKNGKKHGRGKYVYRGLEEYNGSWVNDYEEGTGIQIDYDEAGKPQYRYEGKWRQGNWVSGRLINLETGKIIEKKDEK
ncbi:hypothetical protein [Leptospira koniambonensis]|uniref:hypothetical protein n=1 Tax=Leptospira koniambonensis TaxID=2484950 RepID=UPI003EB8C10A